MLLSSVISFLLTFGGPADGTAGVPVSVRWTPTYAAADTTAAQAGSAMLGGTWIPDAGYDGSVTPDQIGGLTRNGEVHFRWNKYRYEAGYMNNAEAAAQVRQMLEEIGLEHIDSVIVTAYASPEGVYEHNQMLCRKRAEEFEKVVKKELGLAAEGLHLIVRPGGEAWALLRERIVDDPDISATARRRILKLLDNKRIGWDTKKWRMEHGRLGRTPEEGDVYRWMLKKHYRHLRSLAVEIYVSNVIVAVDGPALDVVPEEIPDHVGDEDTTVVAPADSTVSPFEEQVVLTDEVPEPGVVISKRSFPTLEKLDSLIRLPSQLYREWLCRFAPKREFVPDPDAFETFDDDKTIERVKGIQADIDHEHRCVFAPKLEFFPDPDAFEVFDEDKKVDRIASIESVQLLEQKHSRNLAPRHVGAQPLEEPAAEEIPVWPILGVGTNLLYDATYVPGYGFTSIPSLTVEYYPEDGHYTIGTDLEWPNWRHPDQHRFFQIHNVSLWGRYYFKPEQYCFDGWYLSGSANAAMFGLGWNKRGWEGEGLGISAGGGYKWTFGRIYIDAGLALGFLYARYDPYVWGDDITGWYYYDYTGDPDAFQKRRMALYWFGPTRIQVTLGINLFNRNRIRKK
ncbi:MAG: DUF3575 domain-containing protein [Bacteroidales bacterium]|nr:DUF3575 domain-containing protein [Bacteroidales bacterium]